MLADRPSSTAAIYCSALSYCKCRRPDSARRGWRKRSVTISL